MLAAFRRNPRDKAIAALAIPALGTLAIDPLVSIVDTAWVGRLGAAPLASLAIASAVFAAVFSIFNFVHAAVTPLVAGEVGRGDLRSAGAVATGSIVVALAVGVVIAMIVSVIIGPLVGLFGDEPAVAEGAEAYLRIRFLALPAVLVAMVGHGVYRGHSDTKTPLVVAVGMNIVNLVLDPILIFAADMGVTGAAWATVIAQTIAAGWFLLLIFGVNRHRLGTDRLPRKIGSLPIGRIVGAGWPMMIRSFALLLAISATTVAAARIGTLQVAAHQIAMQVWLFLSFVLDSFAIAATALIGTDLGARDRPAARDVANRLLALGFVSGIALSLLLAVTSPLVMSVFSADAGVQADLRSIYPFVILLQPLTALVYVWDGIGLGASAFKFLAGSMVIAGFATIVTLMMFGSTLRGVWLGVLVLTVTRLVVLAWWHGHGAFSSSRDPSPSSQAT